MWEREREREREKWLKVQLDLGIKLINFEKSLDFIGISPNFKNIKCILSNFKKYFNPKVKFLIFILKVLIKNNNNNNINCKSILFAKLAG